jgi:hypothetical protein
MSNYIFHIGRGKTGSTSLYKALNTLGLPCSHHYQQINQEIYELWNKDLSKGTKPNFNIVKYKAFTDHGIFQRHFKLLENLFDQAKFILTIRELESWLDSKDNHVFLRYGYHIDRNEYSERYHNHVSNVLNYFIDDKKDKLLIMNIVDGDGYEKLCPFLNLPIYNSPFPHANIKNNNLRHK